MNDLKRTIPLFDRSKPKLDIQTRYIRKYGDKQMQIRWNWILLSLPLLCLLGTGITFAQAPATQQSAPRKQLSEEQNKSFHPQTPGSMQNIFRAPKSTRSAPKTFNYLYFCGRNEVAEHKAYICVLEDGRIFGGIPANIDENDRIYVFLIVRRWLSHLYKVQIARKRQIQALPSTDVIPANELQPKKKAQFIVRKYVFGPFGPGRIQMVISRSAIARPGLGRVYGIRQIRINRLSQFNVAVAFIGITPVRAQFGLFRERGSSLTRIARKDQGSFAIDFILIAKIYSWQVWDRDLFAGRDVLKPPTFLQRFNINLGFSFQDIFSSFYVGIGFEINRGLDLVVGVNLRSESVLTGGFEEGNLFSGDEFEIPVRQEIRPALYFGLSITPEIFKSVFGLLSNGSLFNGN